ncbi:cell division FtsA domain-containing protein [Clostridiisalibacter paucivorans]|uniref:cell division FtsA domain-containing protein n=1 Tax=Clostridiisalibacter paucivorans TaxID=408753 RepID=UPI0004790374|nr:cell division FtsA domain-containing protein [Clostridiisalibacter paucivorans]
MGYDEGLKIDTENLIFSLDIGTKTVLGIVAICENNRFKILASEIVEHEQRYMYDGQIHDIEGVSLAVKKVKHKLEDKLGIKLERVAIAAAGRALKTYRVKVDREIDITMEIDNRLVDSLEMEGIQKAQKMLEEKRQQNEAQYYCVGHTVVNYYLDDNFMDSLKGHRGNKIGVDLIATFLPHMVVDSLYTVMNRLELEISNITLEPIAAINVAIKKNLRLLNLALVDIGAGTSDIAISKDGAIVAYGMTSVAGDEITEKLARTYLLDYDTAEKLKKELNQKDSHVFYDVVGIKHELDTKDILDSIEEAIISLAKSISQAIIENNQRPPSAVFLIGGGSQVPRITDYIAQELELPKERVVVRNVDIIDRVEGLENKMIGPHSITVIGIASIAAENKKEDFLEVNVNNKKIKLFNSKSMKVSDALVLMGFNPRKLIPKRGKGLAITINGKKEIIKGEIGEPAKIYVNDKLESLECSLKNKDVIKIIEATVGEDASCNIKRIINTDKRVFVNGKKIKTIRAIKINGDIADENTKLNDGDSVETIEITNIKELLEYMDIKNSVNVYKNNELASNDTPIKDDDIITFNNIDMGEDNFEGNSIKLYINGEEKIFQYEKDEFVFIDIFNYINFDLSKPKGSLVLLVNDLKADYYQKLNSGDNVKIYWK